MRFKELKGKTEQELKVMLTEAREKLRDLRFSLQLKQSKNVREIRKTRKLIAQILTILNEIATTKV